MTKTLISLAGFNTSYWWICSRLFLGHLVHRVSEKTCQCYFL